MKKPIDMPMDIRVMQWTAMGMFALALLLCMGSAMTWLLRHPAFSIQGITVKGDVAHSNAVTLRANVLPQLSGNFFTLN
jgi:cell division protein FtsQ